MRGRWGGGNDPSVRLGLKEEPGRGFQGKKRRMCMRSLGGSGRFSKLRGSKADNELAWRPEEEGQPEMPTWWLSTG